MQAQRENAKIGGQRGEVEIGAQREDAKNCMLDEINEVDIDELRYVC